MSAANRARTEPASFSVEIDLLATDQDPLACFHADSAYRDDRFRGFLCVEVYADVADSELPGSECVVA
jgi:hypothetical protein